MKGLTWQSSGLNSTLSPQWARVWFDPSSGNSDPTCHEVQPKSEIEVTHAATAGGISYVTGGGCLSEEAVAPTPVLFHPSAAWKIPWTEEPGVLQSMGPLRVGHDWATPLSLFTFMHWRRKCNPLQCSCLEKPRDGGAWWAAVCGVTQSRTRLKRLSSSSVAFWTSLLCDLDFITWILQWLLNGTYFAFFSQGLCAVTKLDDFQAVS